MSAPVQYPHSSNLVIISGVSKDISDASGCSRVVALHNILTVTVSREAIACQQLTTPGQHALTFDTVCSVTVDIRMVVDGDDYALHSMQHVLVYVKVLPALQDTYKH